ncbi:MAG: Relaxase/Mobilisation nuclease domain [uncultured Clostridium sp.]
MAVTKIIDIKTNLKKSLDYIMNEDKTDGKLLVTGGNCVPEVAYLEFKMTEKMCKELNGDYSKNGSNLAHHVIQSFDKNDKITPEEAHRIGMELAEKLIGRKHEYVIATHIDKGHIHNHIIFNAYSYESYKKFRRTKYTFKDIRAISDEICKENGLSIVENPKGKGKHYKEWLEAKKGTSWKAYIKDTIDELIDKVKSFDELKVEMINRGFEIKEGKHISFKAPNQQRACRGKTIGEEYTKEAIEIRINENQKVKEIIINKDMIINQNENNYLVRVPGSENYIFINKSECNWINELECKVILGKDEYKFIDSAGEKEEILTAKEINNYFNGTNEKSNEIKIENVKIDENVFANRRNKIRDVKELANAIVLLRKENISNKNDFDNRVQDVLNKREKIRDSIKDLEDKNARFNQVSKYLITYNNYKEIYGKYGNKKSIFGGHKKYESEISMFLHAKEKLENLGINTNVNIDKLKEKMIEQKEEISLLSNEFKNIEKRLENIRKANSKIENIIQEKVDLNKEKEQER